MPRESAGDPGRAPEQADASRPSPSQPAEADRLARAAGALAQAKTDAAGRGHRPAGGLAGAFALGSTSGVPGGSSPLASTATPAEGDIAQRKPGAPSPTAGRPGRRRRRDDPAPLSSAIDGLVAETGWELSVAAGSVFGRWAQIVGPDLAAHTAPDGLTDGVLTVIADSTAWATQLRLLARELISKLNAELGDGSVRRVNVRGPGAQSRKSGQWRVRGGRGPRDTYG